jgi:hypothetical protein
VTDRALAILAQMATQLLFGQLVSSLLQEQQASVQSRHCVASV